MKRIALALLVSAVAPAHADEPKLTTKVAAPAAPTAADQAQMKKRATDAVNGYYKALIAGDYDAAATFLRDDAIEPVRAGLLQQLQTGSPKQQQATFEALGTGSLAELKAMPATKFFAAFARSSYGTSLQTLANKELAARVAIDDAECDTAARRCVVKFKVGGKDKDGKLQMLDQTMLASNVDGRWMLGFAPPPAR
jgi:hypothetical protein